MDHHGVMGNKSVAGYAYKDIDKHRNIISKRGRRSYHGSNLQRKDKSRHQRQHLLESDQCELDSQLVLWRLSIDDLDCAVTIYGHVGFAGVEFGGCWVVL